MEFENPHIVYVKTNAYGYITDINSSAFLTDPSGWTEIDRGYGDRYHHAQGNYFPESIFADGGSWRHKLVDGRAVKCSDEEIAEQKVMMKSETASPALEKRVEILETNSTEMKEVLKMILNEITKRENT